MHSRDMKGPALKRAGIHDAVVHFNGDWSGEAIVQWTELSADTARQRVIEQGHEVRIPCALLIAIAKQAALSHVTDALVGLLEQIDAESVNDPPGPLYVVHCGGGAKVPDRGGLDALSLVRFFPPGALQIAEQALRAAKVGERVDMGRGEWVERIK